MATVRFPAKLLVKYLKNLLQKFALKWNHIPYLWVFSQKCMLNLLKTCADKIQIFYKGIWGQFEINHIQESYRQIAAKAHKHSKSTSICQKSIHTSIDLNHWRSRPVFSLILFYCNIIHVITIKFQEITCRYIGTPAYLTKKVIYLYINLFYCKRIGPQVLTTLTLSPLAVNFEDR